MQLPGGLSTTKTHIFAWYRQYLDEAACSILHGAARINVGKIGISILKCKI
jgi:hypothetical protein